MLKDNVEGKIESGIKYFIRKYTFGIIFTFSITFAGVSTIYNYKNINLNNVKEVKVVNEKFELVEKIDKCAIEDIKAKEYSCPSEYTLDNNKCIKIKKIDAKENIICSDGYSLSGNTCISNESTNPKEEIVCELPDNYSLTFYFVDGNITIHNREVYKTKLASDNKKCLVYWCADPNAVSDTVDGLICSGADSGVRDDSSIVKVKKSCPNNYSLIDNTCRTTTNKKVEYTCEKGELNGKKCIITEETDAIFDCPSGYIYNEECEVCEKNEQE